MPAKTHYPIVIIGSGPAGLTAAIYASRANLSPLVLEGVQPGGQLTTTTEVENFPGFEHGIQGPDLIDVTRKQAQRFGAEMVYEEVTNVDTTKRPFPITLGSGDVITADAIIVASGASAKYLGIEDPKMIGKGISACATCDGFFFKNKEVVVVGGGDTAMEEANYLTKFATTVHLVHRREEFRASKIMLARALANPKIKVHTNATVSAIHGTPETGVTGVTLVSTKTGETTVLDTVRGYFSAIGHQPNTGLFKGVLEMDEVGYLKITHPTTNTSIPGIFAAGDVADPIYRQAISAAGEGCKAAIDAERFLAH